MLRKNIHSVHQLELLLLLRRYSERAWLAAEVARELYSEPLAVEDELESLRKMGFLTSVETDNPGKRYRYAPADAETKIAMDELAEAYRNYRVRVIDAIFSRPKQDLKQFSDAFRIWGNHDK